MPRNTDPTQIVVGSGRAGQGSVTASSLNFTATGDPALQPDILAENVRSDELPLLGGQDVQTNLNVINELAPQPRPNRLDESLNALNPSTLSYSPEPVLGRFPDGTATGTLARVINVDALEISGILYPADRGVLAVKLDGVVVQAINLSNVFTEGEPEASAVPARVVGQNDLLIPGAEAAVDGLPLGFALTDRLPQLTSYTRASFAFLGAGPDPVYDAAAVAYAGYQIARVVISVDTGLSSGDLGALELVHYRSSADYFADKVAAPYESFADFQLFPETLYRDADTATTVVINSHTLAPDNVLDTAEGTPRVLSGVTYYGPVDDFAWDAEVTGVYADSFLEEALTLEYTEGAVQTPTYTDYSPNPILVGSDASAGLFLNPDAGGLVLAGSPALQATDPFGRQDTQANSDTNVLLVHTAAGYQVPGDVPSAGRSQVENFADEVTRYSGADLANASAPDPRGTSSTFDPTAALGATELQVRGISSGHPVPAGITGLGGELAYPDTDYTTNHLPNLPGGNSQPNYSGASGNRNYLRAFGMLTPSRDFQLRVVGNPTAGAADLSEDLLIVGRETYSPSGVVMSFFAGPNIVNVGQSVELGGALVDYVVESANSVLFTLRMGSYPLLNAATGLYSYFFAVGIEDASTAATGGDFALYKIELIEG